MGLLDATVITNVRRVAAQYAHHLVPLGCTPEDLAQDLLVHCLERIGRYDPAQASLRTFIDRIIKNKVAAMIEHMLAQKRGAGAKEESLSEPIAIGKAGETIERVETISQDVYDMNAERQSRPATELMFLSFDVDQVVSGLPTDLADLAHLLAAGESLVGVAQQLEVSRATVHRRVVRLRRIFRGAGLDTYINMQEAA